MARRAAQAAKDAKKTGERPRDSAFLKLARERYQLVNDSEYEQDERERDDIAFEAGEQWPQDVKAARKGQMAVGNMPATPARPTLVINKVKEPIRQILNQERAADLGVEIVAADDFGELGVMIDDTEIKLREGLVRRIQRESHAADARTWAYKRAVIAGRGYYLVMTRYLPGKTSDQEIYLHRIYNQAGVKLDPSHEQPDGSDADWGFVGTWVPWDRYVAENPKIGDDDNPYTDYREQEFVGLTEEYPEWYQNAVKTEGSDGKKRKSFDRAVRVVDYWYVERTSRELSTLADGSDVWSNEVPVGAVVADTRMVVERKIKFCKIGGGLQILEETDWLSADMPIVKVCGDELLPFDHQRRFEGMVRPSRGAQQGENYMISKLVETIGLTPISPLQVDPVAIEGYEKWYEQSPTRAFGYLPARSYDEQGRSLKEPHRPAVDPNIFPMAQAIALFDQFIRSTTAVPDPTLGNVDPSLKSGKAIRELTGNAMQSTSNFLDNLARSIRYEGQIINNLLYPIYGKKPGRLVRILNGDGKAEKRQIASPTQPPTADGPQSATLTEDAHFNVIVKVTKSVDSRRTQEADTVGALLSAEPALMSVIGDLFFHNQDGPGHEEMAERFKVMLDPKVQALIQSKSGKLDPVQLQQQVAALKKQLQDAHVVIQTAQQEMQSNQADNETKLKIAAANNMTALEKSQRDNETKLAVAELGAKMDRLSLFLEERARVGMQTHEAQQDGAQHAHELAAAQLDAQQVAAQSTQDHQQTLEQGQQAADLAPEPAQDANA